MASMSSLPRDILLDNIFPYLSIRDFLNFTATCKAFQSYSSDEVYWRKLTASTFRFPAQPIRNEGWQKLYKNLTTARVFTWGSNKNGRLGHSYQDPDVRNVSQSVHVPKEIPGLEREVVVDIKAGGWSTTILTASGAIFSFGSLRGDQYPVVSSPTKLKFPRRLPIKIVEVSSGRSHILALSETGQVWMWQRIQHVGRFINFLHVDTRMYKKGFYDEERPRGTVQKIVAGWDDMSAALVNGVGIVVWWTPQETERQNSEEMLVDGEVVPGTQLTTYGCEIRSTTDLLANKIGEVIDMIAGEGFLVFLTKSGCVWAVNASGPGSVAGTPPVQLAAFSAPEGGEPMAYISGSFRKFAVFNKAGLVYLGSKETVIASLDSYPSVAQLQPEILPSLQNKQIIALAFGDYHYLALTSSGNVFSWGTEPMACGCLGLGPREVVKRKGLKDERLDKPQEVYFTRQQQISAVSAIVKSEFFVFNIAAAGWHSGALVLVPSSYGQEQDRQAFKTSTENEGPRYPRPPVNPRHIPHHFNRPLGEAGHGGRVRPKTSPDGGQSEAIMSNARTFPFISQGPAMPAQAALGPVVTGRSGSDLDQASPDGISQANSEANNPDTASGGEGTCVVE